MGGELLEAYRRIEQRQYLMAVCLMISTIVTLVVLILYAQLSASNIQGLYRYSALSANYSSLVTSSGFKISSISQMLTNLTAKYDQITYNTSNPVTEVIYSNYGVNLPGSSSSTPAMNVTHTGPIGTFNSTYTTRYYTYNFSFSALYPGYLLINATSTKANTQSNSSWEFLVSNDRLLRNGTLYRYNFQSGTYSQGAYSPVASSKVTYTNMNLSDPYSVYAPLTSQSGSNVRVPVNNGTVRVWIVNYANQSIGVTFSAKYVGIRSR